MPGLTVDHGAGRFVDLTRPVLKEHRCGHAAPNEFWRAYQNPPDLEEKFYGVPHIGSKPNEHVFGERAVKPADELGQVERQEKPQNADENHKGHQPPGDIVAVIPDVHRWFVKPVLPDR